MIERIQKILILRFSSLGDIVMTTAMVRSLRKAFPRARIDMVVRADFLDLIRQNPHLDGRIGLRRASGIRGLIRLLKRLNRERYDLVYDAHRSLRSTFLMAFVKAPLKRYFEKHYVRRGLALTFKLRLLKESRRFLERFVEPLNDLGVEYDRGGPEIYLSSAWLAKSSEIHKAAFPSECSELEIGLIPSAQWPGKRWPSARFRELLKLLMERTRHRVIVFGGREDFFCKTIAEGMPPERVLNTQGLLTLGESAAMLSNCRLVVANDTGLMHLADGLSIPSVLIFGPTSAELGCLPFHPLTQVLEHSLWCRPCSKNGQAPCIRSRRHCLERTTAQDAFEAVERLVTLIDDIPCNPQRPVETPLHVEVL